ncbi:MAG: VCBS repeat-containing protein [Planctomycetes bacterium]|nr:VCBS repeat-containing protein [Planctomycetota bacterium]
MRPNYNHLRFLPFVIPAFAFLSSLTPAQDLFVDRQFSGPKSSQGICTGDFNNDGRPDIATADGATGLVSVMFGQNGVGFSAPTSFALSGGGSPMAICSADFNHDGRADLAIASQSPDQVEIWLGAPSNQFVHSTNFAVGQGAIRIAAGKMDSTDNHPDIVVLCQTSKNVWVLRGNGTGGILGSATVAPPSVANSVFEDLATGDLNNDGMMDVAVCDSVRNRVWIAKSNGAGSLVQSQYLVLGAGTSAKAVAIGDYDNDGSADLFVNENGVQILVTFHGNGNGTVVTTAVQALSDGTLQDTWKLIVGDFSADGKLDLGVSYTNDVEVHLYYQTTPGVYGGGSDEKWLATGTGNAGFVFADFDGDGNNDVAAPSSGAAGVTLVRGEGAGQFQVPGSAYGSPVTASIVAGDFNRDGFVDIISADTLFGRILLSYGDGGTGFVFFGDAPSVVGSPWHIDAGDFNSDGVPDVVTANKDNDSVAMLLNDGTGMFNNPTYSYGFGQPTYVVVADFDLNGIDDIVVSNSVNNNVSVLLGDGAGGWTSNLTYSTGAEPMGMAVGDINEDGMPDVVTANRSAGTISTCFGMPGGALSANIDSAAGAGTFSVALGDVDGDIHLDVAAANSYDATVTVRRGDGSGAWITNDNYSVGGEPTHVILADVSGDGRADLVTVHHDAAWRDVGILVNDGTGAFGAMTTFAMYSRQSFYKNEVLAVDMNGNGQMDLVTANGLFCSIYNNQRAQPGNLALYNYGTTGCHGRIALSANDSAHINAPNFAFTATGAPVRALGLGIVTNAADFVGSDPFFLYATLYVDLFNASEIYIVDFISDTATGASAPVAIPNDGGLIGNQYYLQTIWVEPASAQCKPSLFGIVSSALLSFTIAP